MSGDYPDFRAYLRQLEQCDLLRRIARPMNKDTEMYPFARIQFRGLPESARKGFLFENVTDARGRRYDIPVAAGCVAASKQIYLEGMRCKTDAEVTQRWTQAQVKPLPPVIVTGGPAHEVVYRGSDLTKPETSLDKFPIPISTPGFDNAPYITAGHWITKDPESGIRNVGNYRGMIKSRNRIGCMAGSGQHITAHWRKCRKRGIPLQVAIAIGVTPNISFTAVAKLPLDADELAVAGGLAGEPVEVVRCKTVDLEVPAHAEIVIEGIMPTDALEWEGPFGEFTGYMGLRGMYYYLDVTCITHRRDPIYMSFVSEFPPSESSTLRQIALEGIIYKQLTVDLGIKVKEVALHESAGSWGLCVLRMAREENDQAAWKALEQVGRKSGFKMVVAVDEDVNCRDSDAVNWALSFHMQPNRDSRVIDCERVMGLDHSLGSMDQGQRSGVSVEKELQSTSLLLNATRKWPYPPVSLPAQGFMERALEIWREEGLPEPNLKEPWFGYALGCWTEEDQAEAALAVKGEHFVTGEKFFKRRKKIEGEK